MGNRLIALSLLLLVASCSRKACGPTDNPIEDIIFSDSFEADGQPRLDGWTVSPGLTSFVRDAPPGGGSWTLQLTPGWAPQEGFAQRTFNVSSGGGIYRLTVWSKCSREGGGILMGVLSQGELVHHKTEQCISLTWVPISICDTLVLEPGDELFVKLTAGTSEVETRSVTFDLVQLEQLYP